MKRFVICLLAILGAIQGPGTFAADLVGNAPPPVAMDGRFSGFDAIAHIGRHHPRLAPWAESVSHWAGYYSVNPLLLALVLETPAGPQPLTLDSIRNAARGPFIGSAHPFRAAEGRAVYQPAGHSAEWLPRAPR